MQCPLCEKQIKKDWVLISKATDPEEEDAFAEEWWCESCATSFSDDELERT